MKKDRLKPVSTGPLKNEDGIPYDYIVVIDSGSKGSRVFVYNWLNPYYMLKINGEAKTSVKLVKKFQYEEKDGDTDVDAGSDTDDDTDVEDETETSKKNKNKTDKQQKTGSKPSQAGKKLGNKNKDKDKSKITTKLPHINHKKKWRVKVKPGISAFSSSPQKLGNHHLKHMLSLAGQVVPKSQRHRTPVFLHSTAGMRLLNPTEQQQILDSACEYFQTNSDFFVPDCKSHVNVIGGDVEGLYGWLAVNSMVDSFDDPKNHQHGKNHTTYGLLDMGGASTQVVFQPNQTEIGEHENNLYKIHLFQFPQDQEFETTAAPSGIPVPSPLNFSVYSDSFLGLGMSQAYEKYLSSLVENSPQEGSGFFYKPPIIDPCLPKGHIGSVKVNDISYDFTGDSNFEKCLTSIFPVLSKSSYGSKVSGDCKEYVEGNEVSSCLLNDLIPAFDFDINHFYGVSGYWYAVSKLSEYNKPNEKRKNTKKIKDKDTEYDYKSIYENTKNICSRSYSELLDMNSLKPEKDQLDSDELTNLCFKSSWILNFLHLGLGFPRFGIDEVKQDSKFKSLQMVDKIHGSEFSWTLGRALLYANDEYIQAVNAKITESSKGEDGKDQRKDEEPQLYGRSGFFYSPSEGSFHYGSEQNGIPARPVYVEPRKEEVAKYPVYDYEKYDNGYAESKWYIEPHRWYGIFMFAILLGFIVFLLTGHQGRTKLIQGTKDRFKRLKVYAEKFRGNRYQRVNVNDVELAEFEISDNEERSPTP